MIRNHSLHKANIVLVPMLHANQKIDNDIFMTLFHGDEAEGVNFVDDPVMHTKLINVPKLGLQVAWEGIRLRIEDQLAHNPEESLLPKKALEIFKKLFPGNKLGGYGFNFSIFYQTTEVIRIQEYFNQLAPGNLDLGEGLLDFGWQWTLAHKDGKKVDGYFLKVASPMEIAVLHNTHFNETEVPTEGDLVKQFSNSFEATHALVKTLKL